ncbi:hypothetical protein P3T76_006676 [Phytophthora citrophthora]|uniref:Mesoderm development candidate 2 n=1 Tax=Phytophthora citrophthora TaxID=4793 RepID=A0AAD9GN32_9STRA|nr:hypothetical protein P3T76_006676 [Phytophthora citrophthora]
MQHGNNVSHLHAGTLPPSRIPRTCNSRVFCSSRRKQACEQHFAEELLLGDKVSVGWWSLQLLLLLVLLLQSLDCCHTKTIDYEALEKAWEAGDDEQELRTEGDEHYRQLGDKNEKVAKALGPQMIFVTMNNRHSEPLPDIASRWKEMLWNGGVEVNIYEVADSKLLVGLQKGIFVDDVRRFLDEQHEVREYEWNGDTYTNRPRHKKKRTEKFRTKESDTGAKNSKRTKGSQAKRNYPRRKPTQTEFAATRSNDEL